jgi:Transglutaminase-like superfamily
MACFERFGHRWRQWQQLSHSERAVLMEAAFWLPIVALTLRLFGLRRGHSLLAGWVGTRADRTRADDQATAERAERVGRMVRTAAAHGLLRTSCLPQSVTLWLLLRRDGVAADLRIGVRKESDRLAAHAWVEWQGLVLGDHDDVGQRFTPLRHGVAQPGDGRWQSEVHP